MLATTVGASSGRRSRRLIALEVERRPRSLRRWWLRPRSPASRGRSRARVPSRASPRRSRGRRSRCPGRSAGRSRLPGLGKLQQELQAEAGGRVGAGAEGLAGVDDDVDRALARLLPGGAQPEPSADQERLVEVLPAVGPVVGDLGRNSPRPGRRRPQPRSPPARAARPRRRRSRTRRSPARAPPRPRSGPARSARREPSRPARGCSGPRGGSTERPAHAGEEALVVLLGARCCAARALASSFSASSRCSSERSVGTITWTTIAQVAGRTAVGAGQAVSAQRELGAVLDAGGELDLPLSLVAGDLHAWCRASPRAPRSRPRASGPGRASGRAAPRSRSAPPKKA